MWSGGCWLLHRLNIVFLIHVWCCCCCISSCPFIWNTVLLSVMIIFMSIVRRNQSYTVSYFQPAVVNVEMRLNNQNKRITEKITICGNDAITMNVYTMCMHSDAIWNGGGFKTRWVRDAENSLIIIKLTEWVKNSGTWTMSLVWKYTMKGGEGGRR